MANTEPYARMTGTLSVYIAPNTGTAEAEPAVNTTPAGGWVSLGPTDGDQTINHVGGLTYFFDNDHQGPVKSVRGEEQPFVGFSVVGLTLENYARILDVVADVTSAVGPPATKKLPIKRGSMPAEYSLLLKGAANSPYGDFPGQIYIPKCVEGGEPVQTRSKTGSPALECEFHIIEDDDQTDGNEMGWMTVQTA